MGKSLHISLIIFFLFFISCAGVINKGSFKVDRKATYAVIPFENYTETPLAGFRVAAITEGVLKSKGIKVIRIWNYSYKEPSEEELRIFFEKARNKADYIVSGTVNEFRYKTGIDGEPAVSITLYIYETKTGKRIYTGTASASGWAHESLGTVTQKLINKLLK